MKESQPLVYEEHNRVQKNTLLDRPYKCREMFRVLTYITIAVSETVAWIKLFNSDYQYLECEKSRKQNVFKVSRATQSVTTFFFCCVFPPLAHWLSLSASSQPGGLCINLRMDPQQPLYASCSSVFLRQYSCELMRDKDLAFENHFTFSDICIIFLI